MQLKWKTTCKWCEKKYESILALSMHVIRTHHSSPKKYYISVYGRRKGDGFCKECGKKTEFISLKQGFHKFCSRDCSLHSPERVKECIRTMLREHGVVNTFQLEETKEKTRIKLLKTRGVTHISQDPTIKKQKERTNIERRNVKNQMQSPDVRRKLNRVIKRKYGKPYYFQTEQFKEQNKRTRKEKYGDENYNNPKKASETYQKRTGYKNPLSNPELREAHPSKPNRFNGFQSSSEDVFSTYLDKFDGIDYYISNYYLASSKYSRRMDFALFKKNKLLCIIEIDGEYWHSLLCDADAIKSKGNKDYLRWSLIPKGVKFLVIDSSKLKEGFKELQRILLLKYKDWKKEMLRSIPKNIEDAIPKFSKKRMLYDWDKLCHNQYYIDKGAEVCKSILLTYCRSHWNRLKDYWKNIRKTLYKSPLSSHHLLEGLDNFDNVVLLREKFRKKYRGIKEVIVKHHSTEKMLAICSLGKTYISKEPIDKESKRIIKFLNLNAYTLK